MASKTSEKDPKQMGETVPTTESSSSALKAQMLSKEQQKLQQGDSKTSEDVLKQELTMRDYKKLELKHTFSVNDIIRDCKLFKDSKNNPCLVFVSNDDKVYVNNAKDFSEISTLLDHKHSVHTVDVCPPKWILASGDSNGYLKLWDMQNYSLIESVEVGPSDSISRCRFNIDGSLIFTSTQEGFVKMYSILPTKKTKYLDNLDAYEEPIVSLFVGHSNESKDLLVSGSQDTKVRVYDINKRKMVNLFPNSGLPGDVCLSKNGNLVFATDSEFQCIRVFDRSSKKNILKISDFKDMTTSIHLMENENFLLCGDESGSISMVDLRKCGIPATLPKKSQKAQTSDVKLSSCSVFSFQPHKSSTICAISALDELDLVASCGEDNTCILYDIK